MWLLPLSSSGSCSTRVPFSTVTLACKRFGVQIIHKHGTTNRLHISLNLLGLFFFARKRQWYFSIYIMFLKNFSNYSSVDFMNNGKILERAVLGRLRLDFLLYLNFVTSYPEKYFDTTYFDNYVKSSLVVI